MNNAISNTDLLADICGGCDCTGFAPALTVAYNSGGHTVTVTDGSTYSGGDARKIVQFEVRDCFGNKITGAVLEGDGDNAQAVSVVGFDASQGFTIKATVVSKNGCISDGRARLAPGGTSGVFGAWDKDSSILAYTDTES